MSTKESGDIGEQAAAGHLIKAGFKLLERNWNNSFAEIDIVMSRNETIYFVEVKYRKTTDFGDGFDYITATKLHHMQRAAEAWVQEKRWKGPYELMAAAVCGDSKALTIEIREVA